MRPLRLLSLALLAGCVTAPPAVEPPLSYPPSTAARIIRIALGEWAEWGQRSEDAAAPGVAAVSPAESDAENFPRMLAYWRAVPEDHGAIRDNRRRYAETLAGGAASLWRDPAWSAAFVSWVFRTAGVDTPEFPPSATHALYLDALIANARRFPDHAPFVPRTPEDYTPRPGDLVCRDRSPVPLRHWSERLAEAGTIRAMHCDIVVRIAEDNLGAVGGNVRDAVTMTTFGLSPGGRLLPVPPGRPPILLIMESRLGRLPPWSDPTR